jgi:hypothetical protein
MQVRDWLKLLLPIFYSIKYQIAFSSVSLMEEANFRRLQPSTLWCLWSWWAAGHLTTSADLWGLLEEPSILEITSVAQ